MTVIADIRLTPLVFEMPKDRARFDARGGGHRRTMTLLELTTDDGVTGIGEAFGGPGGAAVAFFEAIREQFIGTDPLAFPHIAARVLGANYHMRAQGQMGACLSGIGTAALDAAGKVLGVPVLPTARRRPRRPGAGLRLRRVLQRRSPGVAPPAAGAGGGAPLSGPQDQMRRQSARRRGAGSGWPARSSATIRC